MALPIPFFCQGGRRSVLFECGSFASVWLPSHFGVSKTSKFDDAQAGPQPTDREAIWKERLLNEEDWCRHRDLRGAKRTASIGRAKGPAMKLDSLAKTSRKDARRKTMKKATCCRAHKSFETPAIWSHRARLGMQFRNSESFPDCVAFWFRLGRIQTNTKTCVLSCEWAAWAHSGWRWPWSEGNRHRLSFWTWPRSTRTSDRTISGGSGDNTQFP